MNKALLFLNAEPWASQVCRGGDCGASDVGNSLVTIGLLWLFRTFLGGSWVCLCLFLQANHGVSFGLFRCESYPEIAYL